MSCIYITIKQSGIQESAKVERMLPVVAATTGKIEVSARSQCNNIVAHTDTFTFLPSLSLFSASAKNNALRFSSKIVGEDEDKPTVRCTLSNLMTTSSRLDKPLIKHHAIADLFSVGTSSAICKTTAKAAGMISAYSSEICPIDYIHSCYGAGYWIGDMQWVGDDAWK